MKKSLFLKFSIFYLSILFIIACTQKTTTDNQTSAKSIEEKGVAAKKRFVYCSSGSPSSFNPQIESDGVSLAIAYHIYNRLFDFEYGTTKVIPSLVEKLEVSENGLEYILDIKKGVKFHTTPYFTPTREMNADDVLFTFQRQMDPKHPYHNVNGGVYEYFQAMDMKNIIKDIVRVNDHKIRFILSRPNAPFRANLAMNFVSIVSKEYADKMLEAKTPEKFDHQPIGTGPFVFDRYVKDTTVRLEAFKDYFSDKEGNIDTLIFAITPDANVRLQKLKTNECQLIAYPAPEDLEIIRKDPNLKLIEQPGFNVGYLAMNTKKKPFDNKYVRQAVNHALNKDAYISAVYLGNAQRAKNPLPPKDWAYNEDTKEYDYNIEKAKALLKKAGLSQGFETDLWVMPVARPYMPTGRKLGEMMQADLAKVGIRVQIITYDWPTYLERAARGEHTLIQFGWTGDNGDPDNFLYTLLSCAGTSGNSNAALWCHKPYDELVTQAQKSNDYQERIRLYKKAQVIFKEEAPWVPIAHSIVYSAMRKNVLNHKIKPVGSPDTFIFTQIR